MRIAVDIGFGYTKVVSEKEQKVLFPSVVGTRVESTFSVVDGFAKNDEDYEITITKDDGEKSYYYVGESAIAMGGNRTWEYKASQNRNLFALIGTAIHLVQGDEENIDLAVGLPMGFYEAQRMDLMKTLQNLSMEVQIKESKKSFNIQSVFVFPQGAGSYYSALFDIEGNVINADLQNKPVGVINVGYRTTDYLYMQLGRKGVAPNPRLTGSVDEGMNQVHKDIQSQLTRLIKREPSILKVEQALRWHNGEFRNGPDVINLNKYEQRAYEDLSQRIISDIKIKWGDNINDLAAVLIGGGGGDSLYPYFDNQFPATKKINEASFSDAIGFLAAQAQAMKLQSRG